jgi:hypothetical protein
MTEMTFTATDADALAAKLETCDFSETERRVLSAIIHRAAGLEDSEVEGFGYGVPSLIFSGGDIFTATKSLNPPGGLVGGANANGQSNLGGNSAINPTTGSTTAGSTPGLGAGQGDS